MRKREIIRDKKKNAQLDIPLDRELIEQYVFACMCPFCKDGVVYKMLPLHIYHMHGISAYELREEFGLNRHHKLISPETSERMSGRNKNNRAGERLLKHPNWGDITSRYQDGGKREEAIETQKAISNSPEAKKRFAKAMAGLDRKAIALTIPRETRIAISRIGARAFWDSMTTRERKRFMAPIRALRTPESENVRKQHATETMNKLYRSNTIWCEKWRKQTTEAIQAKAKVPRSDYAKIVSLYKNGISQPEIASHYGVSRGLIHLIIKSQKLGLSKLYKPNN